MKNSLSVVIALAVTAALLLLMSGLIKSHAEYIEPEEIVEVVPDFIKEIKVRQPVRPNLPQPPAAEPADIKGPNVLPLSPKNTENIQIAKVELAEFNDSLPEAIGQPNLGAMDRSAMPMYRSQPAYPPIAAQKGLEGWVTLKYDVDQTGTVSNIIVVAAEPKRIFNDEAIKALKKWRFKPAMVNGQPMTTKDQTVTLEFNLED